jgi:branched-chain amino acid transport system substrate-binding protein
LWERVGRPIPLPFCIRPRRHARHPLNSSDFSFLLQAQASKAKVVALANAGGDTTNALKQASEFGLTQAGQKMIAPGLYSATMHYLKAIEAIKTDEAPKVMAQMRATPINDFFAKNCKIRIDGRMVHDMYLFEVKKPEESKGEWDLYKQIATVARRRSLPSAGQRRLPAGEDELVRCPLSA